MSADQSKDKLYVGPLHMGDEAICLNNVSYKYPGNIVALQDIDLHVSKGSTLAIVGPNGAGKTTLLKIILGLLPNYTGKVEVGGMTPEKAQRTGRIIGWAPQRQNLDWNFPISVRQVVQMGLVGKTGVFRRFKKDDLDFAESVMNMLGVHDIANSHIGALSGGQQQRVIISRALAARPAILALDEPTVGVDKAGQESFYKLIEQIKAEFGVTLIVVSHDLSTIFNISQRIACLHRTLHFHDAPQKLTSETIEDVFHIKMEGLVSGHDHGEAK